MSARVERLDREGVRKHHRALAAFERSFTYPLGGDRFSLDHGADYLAFFETLGTPDVRVVRDDDVVVGLLVAVLRTEPTHAWYLCDLKVLPRAGARGLAPMLLRAFEQTLVESKTPFFGVSMNPPSGRNPIERWIRRRAPHILGPSTPLSIYTFDAAAWEAHGPSFEAALGPARWLDHAGRKDLRLGSTGLALPLLHFTTRSGIPTAELGSTPTGLRMACVPTAHPLVADLRAAGLTPSAAATVLQRGLDDMNWTPLSTGEI